MSTAAGPISTRSRRPSTFSVNRTFGRRDRHTREVDSGVGSRQRNEQGHVAHVPTGSDRFDGRGPFCDD